MNDWVLEDDLDEHALSDLTRSDYAKVIFDRVSWCPSSYEASCLFTITESMIKTPSDYIGLFKIGFEDTSQCLISKQLSQLNLEEQYIHCTFSLAQFPDLNGYYQFVYINQYKEICGASMPLLLAPKMKKSKINSSFEEINTIVDEAIEQIDEDDATKKANEREVTVENFGDEEISTEKVEDDFLMVHHGLAQKHHSPKTELNKSIGEKSLLTAKCENLEQGNNALHSQIKLEKVGYDVLVEDIKALLMYKEALLLEYHKSQNDLCDIRKENDELKNKMVGNKIKKDAALDRAQNIQKELNKALNKIVDLQEEFDIVSEELIAVKKERNEYLLKSKKLENESNSNNVQISDLKNENIKLADSIELLKKSAVQDRIVIKNLEKEKSEMSDKLQFVKTLCCELNTNAKECHEYQQILNSDLDLVRILDVFQEKNHLNEQLEDAKCMIKALEDSKSLALKEMSDLSKALEELKTDYRCQNRLLKEKTSQLNKALNDLSQLQRENAARMIYLDDRSHDKQNSKVSDSDIRTYASNLQIKLQTEQSESKKKAEKILQLEERLQECREKLDKETDFKKNLVEQLKTFNPEATENCIDKDLQNLLNKAEALEAELKKVNEEFQKKDDIIKQLNDDKISSSEETANANLKVREIEEENLSLKTEIKELKEKCESLLTGQEAAIEKLKEEMLEDLKIEQITDENQSLKLEIRRLKKNGTRHAAFIENLNKELIVAANEKVSTDRKIEQLNEENQTLKLQVKLLSETCKENKAFIEKLNKEVIEAANEKVSTDLIVKQITEENQHLKIEVKQLSETCEKNEAFIEELNKKAQALEEQKVIAIQDAKEKTARLLEAAQLYRKQYVKIEKLMKKLKANSGCASKASSISSQSSSTGPFEYQTLGSFKKSNSTGKVSDNSDSDTGEHVRLSSSSSQPKQMIPITEEQVVAIFQSIKEKHKIQPGDEFSAKTAIAIFESMKEIYETEGKLRTSSLETQQDKRNVVKSQELCEEVLSAGGTSNAQCEFCTECFPVSANSSSAISEHYEKEHNMRVCPICGVTYENMIPKKYFLEHMDSHFYSE